MGRILLVADPSHQERRFEVTGGASILERPMANHLYLTGFMGAGKTVLGEKLASELRREFVDLDQSVAARAGMTIGEIFEQRGEQEFRRLEAATLVEISSGSDKVVATGGGTVVADGNRRLMQERGVTVWLDVPFPVLLARLDSAASRSRPLARDRSGLEKLFQDRLRFYKTSDVRIELDSATDIEVAAERLLKILAERQCAI